MVDIRMLKAGIGIHVIDTGFCKVCMRLGKPKVSGWRPYGIALWAPFEGDFLGNMSAVLGMSWDHAGGSIFWGKGLWVAFQEPLIGPTRKL